MLYCTKYTSRKLRVLSFIATISVVIIHTNSLESCYDVPIAWWIGNVVAYMQRWAVPFFFVVSGFFFAKSFGNSPIFAHWIKFMHGKVNSIVIPYLLWGIGYGIIAMTLLKMGVAYVNNLPDIWSGTIFAKWGHWAFFDSILGVTHAPLIGALWYMRVLLIVFITAPVWIGALRLSRWMFLITAFVIILISPLSGMQEEHFILSSGIDFRIKVNAFGWIMLGMVCAIFRLDRWERCSKRLGIIAFCLWIVFALLPLQWGGEGDDCPCIVRLAHQLHPCFATVGLWYLGDLIAIRLPDKLPRLFSYGFWIYCIHHPLTGYVGALGNIVFGRSIYAKFVMQSCAWAVVIILSMTSALVCQRYFPKTFNVMNGGR